MWRAQDGSAFATVPAGDFVYGPEETYERLEQAPPPRPRQTLGLDAFHLAVRPVTYAEWKAFLDDTGFRWGGEWWAIDHRPRTSVPFAGRRYAVAAAYPPEMGQYPMVAVSQTEALAYCEWLSGRIGRRCGLPSEEQWEKAARGSDGRTYPWGETRPRPGNPVAAQIPGHPFNVLILIAGAAPARMGAGRLVLAHWHAPAGGGDT